MATHADRWDKGDLYEGFMGRWSRPIARQFLAWLGQPPGATWLDVGCGTGALTETILASCRPRTVTGVDPSARFVEFAKAHVTDARATFEVAEAQALPMGAASFDGVVSGLVLNFVPDPNQAVGEMRRVTRSGGVVAAYVWDYADKMEPLRYFWDAVAALNAGGGGRDERVHFAICRPERLAALFGDAGLWEAETTAIDVPAVFRDFDDYWRPFLGGVGPAGGCTMSLHDAERTALRELLRHRLPTAADGSIHLAARAWAVRGRV